MAAHRLSALDDQAPSNSTGGGYGAEYLPCCPARLVGAGAEDLESECTERLAFLWTERAAALRFRHDVLAMRTRSASQRIHLAKLRREANAYDTGALRLRSGGLRRGDVLIRLLRARKSEGVVGWTHATMAAELSVLLMAERLRVAHSTIDGPVPPGGRGFAPRFCVISPETDAPRTDHF